MVLSTVQGTKAQMHMDKTRFARETGSEEVDLGLFMDDDDEEKENDVYEDFDTPTPAMQTLATTQRSTVFKENSMNKSFDVHSSSRSSTTHVMKEKLGNVINFSIEFVLLDKHSPFRFRYRIQSVIILKKA